MWIAFHGWKKKKKKIMKNKGNNTLKELLK
jgi:hypothetical protein